MNDYTNLKLFGLSAFIYIAEISSSYIGTIASYFPNNPFILSLAIVIINEMVQDSRHQHCYIKAH